jgi:photosystem II stability/assembly factor-like uncharacterized protein
MIVLLNSCTSTPTPSPIPFPPPTSFPTPTTPQPPPPAPTNTVSRPEDTPTPPTATPTPIELFQYGFAGPDLVWLVVGNKLLRTTDNGQQWDTLYQADRTAPGLITFVDEQHGWMIAAGALKMTTDGGQHWADQGPGLPVNAITGAGFVSLQQGWMLLGNPVNPAAMRSAQWPDFQTSLATTDAGATWNTVNAQQPPVWRVQFFDAQHGWGFLNGELALPDPALVYTSDGGQTWLPRASPDCRWYKNRGRFSFSGPTTAWVACGPDIGSSSYHSDLYQTVDGGATWQRVRPLDTGIPGEDVEWVSGLFFLDDQYGWILLGSDNRHSLLRATRDGGHTWQTVAASAPWLEYIRFASPTRGYAIQDFTTLMGTQDGGATWTPLYSTTSP